jgi:hypothetical protein
MSLFARLNEAAGSRGLTFLVIGGHAVIAHGFVRGTEDADIVVCKDDRAAWVRALFEKHEATMVFPDWSGHLPHRTRVPIDQWLAYCRANLARLRGLPGYRQQRRQDGINAEFSL